VWTAYAQFESNESCGGGIEVSRQLFQKGYDNLKEQGLKEERVLLLEAWRKCELIWSTGDKNGGDVSIVDKKMPRKRKMRRATGDNEDDFEEYYDYQFPDDEKPVGKYA
jgi:crooked neck